MIDLLNKNKKQLPSYGIKITEGLYTVIDLCDDDEKMDGHIQREKWIKQCELFDCFIVEIPFSTAMAYIKLVDKNLENIIFKNNWYIDIMKYWGCFHFTGYNLKIRMICNEEESWIFISQYDTTKLTTILKIIFDITNNCKNKYEATNWVKNIDIKTTKKLNITYV